jgi:hypothetical protein
MYGGNLLHAKVGLRVFAWCEESRGALMAIAERWLTSLRSLLIGFRITLSMRYSGKCRWLILECLLVMAVGMELVFLTRSGCKADMFPPISTASGYRGVRAFCRDRWGRRPRRPGRPSPP